MKNEEIIESLNDLLTKAYDAEQGFKLAAERAEKFPYLVEFFNRQSDLRLCFGHELKEAITRHGGTPQKGSSMAAKLHQGWMVVKDTLTSEDNQESILEECIRGEKAALKEYDDKLEAPGLPEDISALLAEQRTRISESLLAVRVEECATTD